MSERNVTRRIVDAYCPVHGWMPEHAHGPAWVRAHKDCGAHIDQWGWHPPRDTDVDEWVDWMHEKEVGW